MNKTIEAVLRLSAKLGSMAAFGRVSEKLSEVDRKARMFNRSQSAINRTLAAVPVGRYLGAAAVGYGAKQSITQFAGVERRLNRIAINADAGKEALTGMFRSVNQIASKYAMSQNEVTEGLEALVASGRSLDEAMSFLPAVTATAQASGSAVGDIATSADALSASFGIAGDRMQAAFDILVAGGKMGKFELRDMASYLPSLAPAFTALGYKGEAGLQKLTAMLQVVRQRTGSSEQAATALSNIFQKMNSEETEKKFSKFGIDLRKELEKARREGRDVLDVFVELSKKAVKGDMSLLPKLFTDAEFAIGMRALISAPGEVDRLIAALRKVDGATIEALGQVLSDTESKLQKFANSWEKLVSNAGSLGARATLPILDSISDRLERTEAIEAGMDKLGYTNDQKWRVRLWGDSEERGRLAYEAGWRDSDPRTGKRYEDRPRMASPDAGMPFETLSETPRSDAIPVPTRRPAAMDDAVNRGPEPTYGRFIPPSAAGLAEHDAAAARRERERLIRQHGASMFPGGFTDDPEREARDIERRRARVGGLIQRDALRAENSFEDRPGPPIDTRAEAIITRSRPTPQDAYFRENPMARKIPGGEMFTGGFPSADELSRAIADGGNLLEDAGQTAGQALETSAQSAGDAFQQQVMAAAAQLNQALAAAAAQLRNIKVNVQTIGGNSSPGVRADVGRGLAGVGGRNAE